MDSKHGGSPQSGLVPPAGIEQHTEVSSGGIIVPEIHREAKKRQERARQLERRRIALEVLPAMCGELAAISTKGGTLTWESPGSVDIALALADELMAKTGGEF